MSKTRFLTVAAALTFAAAPAFGVTTAGAGSVLVIPVVAQTASYESEIFVRNPNNQPLQITVRFYEANNSTNPGLRPCAPLTLNAQQTVAMKLGTQCTLGPGSHFGMLILENAATEKTAVFVAYNRTQTPSGNGFSVEAFPVGNFSGGASGAIGLKRQAAAPTYQTNCFVGALGEGVDYVIRLWDANNNQLGSDVTGSLLPYQMIRHLDIFAAAGLPAGIDYSVVRATFDNTNPGEPAYVALCTVQESTFFGADFRIAKSSDALDNAKRRQICYSQSTCGTALTGSGSTFLPDTATKYIHQVIVSAPDFIKCELVSAQLNHLEMQLRGPGDTFTSPVFSLPAGYTGPPYTPGGNDQTSFYVFTGHRNAFNNGFSTRLFIDVSYREGSGSPSGPLEYGITCYAGNGITVPWFRASASDNF
jgi:hypothetical protein